ncbi:prevent-host-death protein, partial [Vibrio cholerae]|nr:prevent-host-death protein [Vibrio cholerae]EKF9749874.1 prevent-host-death protein [Vibrio cholerae]MBG8946969.1 prevent-host-death protein [Vibrio cholerae]
LKHCFESAQKDLDSGKTVDGAAFLNTL